MGWTLAPGTGFCEVGNERVFLDLRRDKYIALKGEDRAAFDRLRVGEPNDSDAMNRADTWSQGVQVGLIKTAWPSNASDVPGSSS